MEKEDKKTSIGILDGNEAVAYVAYRTNEVIALYPITPSSGMGEHCDAWASQEMKNIWDTVPSVIEMQSEAGAAGAIHGSLQTGGLSTTFTASQGLLLMIPNMFKIAGELTSTVFHVAARTVATHALSIFGDHSDVMATRSTGFALLASASVQEAMDFALISQAATLQSRIPFLHFFEGFRISHEVAKINMLSDDQIRSMMDDKLIAEHRARALSPEHPVLRGTAQNPDVFFQARETANKYYAECSDLTQQAMDKFAKLVGRSYKLFEYHGAPDAERIIILMGAGCNSTHETVDYLTKKGEKVGVLKVRLYRPFDMKRFFECLPASTKSIAVLDRTKEPGASGDPLYLDTVNAIREGLENGWGKLKTNPKIVGGRYGLSSKEFTPAMIKAVYDNLNQPKPRHNFTVGINDDLTNTSLSYDPEFSVEPASVTRALFYGLGSDGTVSANKSSIKIIGENTPNYAQGYFVYDSRKAGTVTVSHVRFGPEPIKSCYLVSKANFIGCHQTVFLEKYDMLQYAVPGGTFLLNTQAGEKEVWDTLPKQVQESIINKKLKFYRIDAYKVAKETGMGNHINTIMQTCFFAVSGVLPKDRAIEAIKDVTRKTYSKKGEEVVNKNIHAIDQTLANLFEVKVPGHVTSQKEMPPPVSEDAPEYVRKVLGEIIAGRGDQLPVSSFAPDGTFPVATAQWDKRNIALEIPVWDKELCIQCGKCASVCPHASIRIKAYDKKHLEKAPKTFKTVDAKDKDWAGLMFTVQVAPEDCTGCGVCIDACSGKDKTNPERKAINLGAQPPLRESERDNFSFFLKIPETDRRSIKVDRLRQQQAQRPLFEFSGACAGCGETPYVKMLSQLFGDRSVVANATGCSSIYGGNLPTTPWAVNAEGRGPAWANSLFEDNAEFGFGFRLAIDKQQEYARELVAKLSSQIGQSLADGILKAEQRDEAGIHEQRERIKTLKEKIKSINTPEAARLNTIADMLVRKSVWIVGGDGWAYDIGYGGLDHVIANNRDINILVLDTEVYSNTGGQMSKSTPRGAIAKFAEGGKPLGKKDLGLLAMAYGHAYVAQVALGAKDSQTLKAFIEAEAYNGPSIIIAYSHCIAHGIDTTVGLRHQKAAVDSGQWLLYRYNPQLVAEGKNPLQLDSQKPKMPVSEYLMQENRFRQLTKTKPDVAKKLFEEAQKDVDRKWEYYSYLAARTMPAVK